MSSVHYCQSQRPCTVLCWCPPYIITRVRDPVPCCAGVLRTVLPESETLYRVVLVSSVHYCQSQRPCTVLCWCPPYIITRVRDPVPCCAGVLRTLLPESETLYRVVLVSSVHYYQSQRPCTVLCWCPPYIITRVRDPVPFCAGVLRTLLPESETLYRVVLVSSVHYYQSQRPCTVLCWCPPYIITRVRGPVPCCAGVLRTLLPESETLYCVVLVSSVHYYQSQRPCTVLCWCPPYIITRVRGPVPCCAGVLRTLLPESETLYRVVLVSSVHYYQSQRPCTVLCWCPPYIITRVRDPVPCCAGVLRTLLPESETLYRVVLVSSVHYCQSQRPCTVLCWCPPYIITRVRDPVPCCAGVLRTVLPESETLYRVVLVSSCTLLPESETLYRVVLVSSVHYYQSQRPCTVLCWCPPYIIARVRDPVPFCAG